MPHVQVNICRCVVPAQSIVNFSCLLKESNRSIQSRPPRCRGLQKAVLAVVVGPIYRYRVRAEKETVRSIGDGSGAPQLAAYLSAKRALPHPAISAWDSKSPQLLCRRMRTMNALLRAPRGLRRLNRAKVFIVVPEGPDDHDREAPRSRIFHWVPPRPTTRASRPPPTIVR